MEPKKNPEVNLERKRGLFLQIGLVITLLIILGAFEYKSHDKAAKDTKDKSYEQEDQDFMPITKQEKPKPKPELPKQAASVVILEDDVVVKDSIINMDTEFDEDDIDIEEEDDDEVFMVVENMPEFPGGDLGLMKYIQKKVKYPPIAKEYNITGKVYISFVVDKSGSVTNVKVVRGVDKNLDAEAVRVIKSLPKYKPGKQRGKAVRVMFTVPINFTLN